MTRNDCNSIYTNILLFIDNELAEPNVQELTLHVDRCPECSSALEMERANLVALKRLLSGACNEQVSSLFQDQILEQIHHIAEEQVQAEAQANAFGNPFANPFASFTGQGIQTVITTSFSHTQIIENGGVHIQIETTHEIREEFPEN